MNSECGFSSSRWKSVASLPCKGRIFKGFFFFFSLFLGVISPYSPHTVAHFLGLLLHHYLFHPAASALMPVHTIKWIVDTHICDLCLPSTMVGAVLWDVLCFFGLQNNSHSHVPSMLMWTPQSSKMSSCDPQGSPGEVWTCHCYYIGIKCVHTSKACWPGRQLPQLIPKGESNRSAKGSWSLLVVHGYIYTLISSSVSFWRTLHYKHEPSGECVLTALDPGSGGLSAAMDKPSVAIPHTCSFEGSLWFFIHRLHDPHPPWPARHPAGT